MMAGTGPVQPFSELGLSGLRRFSNIVDEEFLRELRGIRGIKTYREMRDNDDIIGGCMFAIENLAQQVEYRIDPADDSPEAADIAEFVRQCLFEDMSHSWHETLSEILTFLTYGWAWMEVVYKVRGGQSKDQTRSSRFDDGRIGWRKWSLRGQDSLAPDGWIFGPDGGILAMKQLPPPDYQMRIIPLAKSLLFRPSRIKNNPEGRSILRNAYRSWYFKKNLQVLEGIGAERDLAGYPVIKVSKDCALDLWNPNDTNAATLLAQLKTIVRSIKRDEQEGAVLPYWCDLSLLSSPSRRQFDTNAIITRYDQRISMTMIADFIMLGHDAVGSKALGISKIDLFCTACDGFLDAICAVINKHAIGKLLKFNGMDENLQPMLTHGKVERVDLAALGTYLQSLSTAGAGIFPNPEIERHLAQLAGLPVAMQEGGIIDDDSDEIPIEDRPPVNQPPPDAQPPAPKPEPKPQPEKPPVAKRRVMKRRHRRRGE